MMKNVTPRKISVVIVIVVLVWIGTGLVLGTKREDMAAPTGESGGGFQKLLKIEELSARPYTRLVSLNGYTKANRMVEMKPEVDGKVVELPVKKGDMVEKGEIIVRLDDRDRKEKLAQARAALDARNIEYKASQELEQKGYRPRIGLAQAKASLEEARAVLAQAQMDYDNTRVRAPFSGRIDELNVEVGTFLLSGFLGSMDSMVMARLVEDEPILVVSQISEKDLPLVNKEAEAKVKLSDGRELKGHIRFLSQYADSESRSFPVEVAIENPNHDIPVGMTANIKLSASQGSAYLVSSSVLALDDAGKVGVKMVGADEVVQFAPVEILANTDEGLWIGGLPERIRLVTQGQAFVSAGQKMGAPAGQ
ncbi:MAG: efflux RND transporter periplasmic adaptor subunit [Alphaproteobacteria bacterium]|nr:efflux RND transporter periplasmic adaptor subunit [Alphaproteobacteria bacterium]